MNIFQVNMFQVGDVVRVVKVDWMEEGDPLEFLELLRQRIGRSGMVKEATVISALVLVDGDEQPTLWTNDEMELVHRPAPKEQLPLIEVQR